MQRTAWVAVVLVLGGLAAPAPGQGGTMMQWKFKEGQTFYVESVSTMKFKADFQGKTYEHTQKTKMVTSYKVEKVTPEGTVLVQKIEGLEAKSEGSFGTDLEKLTEKLKQATFTFTLSKDNKITKFDGYDAFIKTITEDKEETGKVLRMVFSETLFRKTAEDAFAFVPAKPVQKDATWKSGSIIPFGPFGQFKSNDVYTFQGVDDGVAKIGWKGGLVYVPPEGEIGAFGPLKVTKGNMRSEGARGTYYFDIEKGRVKRSTTAMLFRGSLTFDVLDNQLLLDLSVDITETSRTLDSNPFGKR